MTPNFDDLQVTGIKERVIVGKHAFYELECSNGKPDKPIFLAERYVKLFLTEHLNRYNKKYPEEIDSWALMIKFVLYVYDSLSNITSFEIMIQWLILGE